VTNTLPTRCPQKAVGEEAGLRALISHDDVPIMWRVSLRSQAVEEALKTSSSRAAWDIHAT
jgi:hypothetical protein